MVNRSRMVDEFLELTRIDSLSKEERQMADVLKAKLSGMGFRPEEDGAGERIGGNAGNILCTVKGNREVPAILLSSHMDTVVPGKGKKPQVEGDMIRSDGTTILGGDDVAGIVCILEAVRVLQEENSSHGDIQIAFTVGEEGGLWGAKNLDYDKIYAKYGFVLDEGGKIGSVAVRAPSQDKIDVMVYGKAVHAGAEPEKGVSAIQIAAEAIAQMKLGRIDEETTANIGVISGGKVTNIICDKVEIKAEARSRDQEKLKQQTAHMRSCFEAAALKFGGSVQFKSELMYSAFVIEEDDEILGILKKAAKAAGVDLKPGATGGGSDTNVLNARGIKAINMSVGMDKAHSVEEQISITDMERAAGFLVEIIKAIE